MSRRYITQMGEHEEVDDIFLVIDKQLRSNRNGNLYLLLRLADRTGNVNAMMWNANDRSGADFETGDYARVEGTTQFYNGNLQVIVQRVESANPGEINEDELLQIDRQKTEKLMERAAAILRCMENTHLLNLAEIFLVDEPLMSDLKLAPAGIKAHHAYQGGLLEHVVSLMELAELVAKHYDEIDKDLLVIGAFLHDIGKLRELTFDRGMGYSDEGQLLGHLVIGIGMVDQKISEAEQLSGEAFPVELALRIKHMLLSHHGLPEYGSPKAPMTFEAIALRNLDELDAKMGSFRQVLQEDVNDAGAWTNFQPALGIKIFKGEAQ